MAARRSETVQLTHPAGGTLSGVLELAEQETAVVYVHGFGSHRDGEKAQAMQAACAARGLGYAAFDFRGHGASSGTMTELRASGLLDDLDVIRAALAARGVTRLYLVGSSMGGFASAWYAQRRPEAVVALVLLAPAFHFLHGKLFRLDEAERARWQATGRHRFRNQWMDAELGWGLVEECEQFDPERLAAGWRTPTLIFHGLEDDVVPWQDSVALVERSPFRQMEVRLWRDGDHRLQGYRAEMAGEACRFFVGHGV